MGAHTLPLPVLGGPGNPYLLSKTIRNEVAIMWFEADLLRALEISSWSLVTDNAVVVLSPATWDTVQLGVRCGYLRIATAVGVRTLTPIQDRGLRSAIFESNFRFVRGRVLQRDKGALRIVHEMLPIDFGRLLHLSALLPLTSPRQTDVDIRPAGPSDRTVVGRLAERGYRNRLFDIPHLSKSRIARSYGNWAQNDAAGRTTHTLIAWRGSIALGFLAGDLEKLEQAHDGYLDLMVVDPQSRGLGVGGCLMFRAGEIAHQRGLTRLALGVDELNARGRGLYGKLGFSEEYAWVERAIWVEPV
jgi:ribosomal protein S18 acetylase RimI-like enzyme